MLLIWIFLVEKAKLRLNDLVFLNFSMFKIKQKSTIVKSLGPEQRRQNTFFLRILQENPMKS